MTRSVQLIVLGYTKFGENSIVLHTLSQAYGRRGFLVRVGKHAGMSLFLPLNVLDAEVVETTRATLWPAHGMSCVYPLAGVRNNLYKNTMTLFMSEVLYRAVKDGMNEDGLYDWCLRSILTLDALQGDFANFHVRWLLELADALGFRPGPEDLLPFVPDSAPAALRLLESDLPGAMLVPLSGEARNTLCEGILRYLEFHTESALAVRSLAVLREVFA